MIDCTQVGRIKLEFYEGVEEFITACVQIEQFTHEGIVRCPCPKCKCRRFLDIESIRYHLYNDRFKFDYWVWTEIGKFYYRRINSMWVMLEVVRLGSM